MSGSSSVRVSRLRRALDYVVSLVKWYCISVVWHEGMHVVLGQLMGIKALIALEPIFLLPTAGHIVVVELPASIAMWQLRVFYGGAGLLTAVFLLLWRLFEQDPQDQLMQVAMFGAQLGYGLAESLIPTYGLEAFYAWAPIAVVVATSVYTLLQLWMWGWRLK